MKLSTAVLLLAGVLPLTGAGADTVVEAVPDTLVGESAGGLSGFMVGAAAGGPVGALVGAGVGWLSGGAGQQAANLEGTAYRVVRDDGSEIVVRSPGRDWSPGARVRIVNNRLVAANESPLAVHR